jgi:F0F1-type ATP synthase assembly protein I
MTKPSPLIQLKFPVGLVVAQAGMILLVAVVVFVCLGLLTARSAAIGALISWLASSYVAFKAFRHGGNPRLMLAGFYQGLLGKFVIIAAGFFVAFRSVSPLSPVAMLLGFIAVQAVGWVYPLWFDRRKS